MTALSRRSILFAPVALAAASIAPRPKRAPLRVIFGERMRAYIPQPGCSNTASGEASQPFDLLSSDVRIGAPSLDGASRLPEIGDQRHGAVADGVLGASERLAPDESDFGHPADLGDHRSDDMVRFVGIVDEQIGDQRAQQEPRAGELDRDQVQRRFVLLRHIVSSQVSATAAMLRCAASLRLRVLAVVISFDVAAVAFLAALFSGALR